VPSFLRAVHAAGFDAPYYGVEIISEKLPQAATRRDGPHLVRSDDAPARTGTRLTTQGDFHDSSCCTRAGRIGQIHAANVAANPRAKLVAVADPIAASGKALAAKLNCESATMRRN